MKKIFLLLLVIPLWGVAQTNCPLGKSTIIAQFAADSLPGGDTLFYFTLPEGKWLNNYSIQCVTVDTIEGADLGIFLLATNQRKSNITSNIYTQLADSLSITQDSIHAKYFIGENWPYPMGAIKVNDNGCTEGILQIIVFPN